MSEAPPAHAWRNALSRLQRAFPLLSVLREYRRGDFGHDLTAGLLIGVLTVPQALAYAHLAGLPPQTGLYASLLPMVVYAAMGTSREMIVGPVAVAALLVAATVGEHAGPGSATYGDVTAALTVEVGAAYLVLFALRGSGIVNLLAGPVVTGFINAAVVLIVLNQLDDVMGLTLGTHAPLEQVRALLADVTEFNPATLALALLALGILGVFRLHLLDRLLPGAPIHRLGPIVAVVATSALVAGLHLDTSQGVATVGPVPGGLPPLVMPSVPTTLWIDLAPSAAIIALVAFVGSYSVGATLAARRRRRIHADQELLALGMANLASAVTGGYAVAGSISRSSVNFAAGARTPVSALICAVLILFTLVFVTDLFEPMPNAVLAVIIIMSVVGLIEITPLREQWRFSRRDAALNLGTFVGVLLLGIEAGLIGGIIAGLALLVHRTSRPHVAPLGRLGDSDHFRNINRYPEARTTPGVLAIRIDESIQFTNVRYIESFILRELASQPSVRHLVIVCNAVNFIDSTGVAMLERLCDELAALDIDVHLAEVKSPVMDRLNRSDLPQRLTGSVHFTTADAMRALDPHP